MDKISDLFDLFGETSYCSICLEDCVEGQRVRSLNECFHIFHMKCIENWFIEKQICPTCRKEYHVEIPVIEAYDNVDNIERLYLTWVLIHGILKTHKQASQFNEKKEQIKILFSLFFNINYKPLPVDLGSRYSLELTKQYIANRIHKLQHIDKNKIYRQPYVYRWVDKIESSLNYKSSIEHLWRM